MIGVPTFMAEIIPVTGQVILAKEFMIAKGTTMCNHILFPLCFLYFSAKFTRNLNGYVQFRIASLDN